MLASISEAMAMTCSENLVGLLAAFYPLDRATNALQTASSDLREGDLAQSSSWARIAAMLLCAAFP
jgi:hypothetical protein